MANPKSKVLPQIFEIYLFVFIAHCFDVFYYNFMGDASILGTNLYGHVIGLLCIGVVCVFKKKDIRAYGAVLKPKRIFKGFYRGALFSIVPMAIVAGFFSLIYAAFDVSWAKVRFLPPNHYPAGEIGIVSATVIYALALILSVFMKEFFFRGYVIRTARSVYQFFDANCIQIILCIPFPLVIHFRNILVPFYNEQQFNPLLIITVGLFWIAHEALTAFKWGLLARVSRDVWTTFFDHYLYRFFAFSIFVSQAKIANYSSMVKLLLVQLISLGMVWIYYKKKRAEKEQKTLQQKMDRLERHQRRERGEENYSVSDQINEKHAKSNEAILEDYADGNVQQRIDDYSSAKLLRHRNVPNKAKDYKDESLMDLSDINVDEFYLEYAKEVSRKRQGDKDDTSKKLAEQEDKVTEDPSDE